MVNGDGTTVHSASQTCSTWTLHLWRRIYGAAVADICWLAATIKDKKEKTSQELQQGAIVCREAVLLLIYATEAQRPHVTSNINVYNRISQIDAPHGRCLVEGSGRSTSVNRQNDGHLSNDLCSSSPSNERRIPDTLGYPYRNIKQQAPYLDSAYAIDQPNKSKKRSLTYQVAFTHAIKLATDFRLEGNTSRPVEIPCNPGFIAHQEILYRHSSWHGFALL